MTEAINPDSGWVAGQAADGHGILCGWEGRGDVTRAQLLELARIADIPTDWLPPVKDAGVQLGRAMVAVAGHTFDAKPVRKGRPQDRPGGVDAEPIRWQSRWRLSSNPQGNEAIPGAPVGRVLLVATLWVNEDSTQITWDRDTDNWDRATRLRDEIMENYEQRIAQQRYMAADITKWLGDLLRRRLGAVRYGGTYYVPRGGRDIAEILLDTVRRTGWGTNWLYPFLPIASGPQLALGLAIGLQGEVAEVMAQLDVQRKAAKEAGRVDIGPRALETFQRRFNLIADRITEKAELLGEERVNETQAVLADAMILLDSIAEMHESAIAA